MTIWGTYGIILTNSAIALGYFASPFLPALAQVLIFGGFVLELFVYAMTYGPIMWMWVAEALQPSQIGYAAMASWGGGAALVLVLFPIVQQRLENQGFIFMFFAFFALSSLLVTSKLMLETKGKKDFEITEEYEKLDVQIGGAESKEGIEMQMIEGRDRDGK